LAYLGAANKDFKVLSLRYLGIFCASRSVWLHPISAVVENGGVRRGIFQSDISIFLPEVMTVIPY
jgi:hypothetical protein